MHSVHQEESWLIKGMLCLIHSFITRNLVSAGGILLPDFSLAWVRNLGSSKSSEWLLFNLGSFFFPRLTLAGSWCSSTRLVDTLPLRPSKGWVDHKSSRNIAHGHMSSRYEDKLYQLEWWMMVYSIFPGSKKTRGSGMFSIVQFLFPWYFTQSTPADISDRWRQRLQSLT